MHTGKGGRNWDKRCSNIAESGHWPLGKGLNWLGFANRFVEVVEKFDLICLCVSWHKESYSQDLLSTNVIFFSGQGFLLIPQSLLLNFSSLFPFCFSSQSSLFVLFFFCLWSVMYSIWVASRDRTLAGIFCGDQTSAAVPIWSKACLCLPSVITVLRSISDIF